METLKKHWKTIAATSSIVILVVIVIALTTKLYSEGYRPVPLVTSQEIDLKIRGNKNSKIYHIPGCPNYNDIAERNVVWFKTKEDAEAAGYRMAKNC